MEFSVCIIVGMSPYVCDCTNVVYTCMFCVYCIYYYVNKFEARSLFSTSHLKICHYVTSTKMHEIIAEVNDRYNDFFFFFMRLYYTKQIYSNLQFCTLCYTIVYGSLIY